MSVEVLKRVIGLLVSDASFRDAFRRDPEEALADRSLVLTEAELAQLIGSNGTEDGGHREPKSEILDDRIKRRSDDMI